MLVVKIGGPAYRIGMGGGAASSVPSGSNKADLDFNAVQVWQTSLSGYTKMFIYSPSLCCWDRPDAVARVVEKLRFTHSHQPDYSTAPSSHLVCCSVVTLR
jgi:hypothetical protein